MKRRGFLKGITGAFTVAVVSKKLVQDHGVALYDGVNQRDSDALFIDGDGVATPTLAFGDGDTGFYANSDGNLSFAIGGTRRFHFKRG